MTTQTLYRFLCDGPRCKTTELGEDRKDAPDGWRIIKSTDHIPVPPPRPPYTRRQPRTLSYPEQCRGSFTLHLCPHHTTAFDAHHPRTDGVYTRPGRDGQAYVSCSCGVMRTVLCGTGWRIASADMTGPAAYTEKAWWLHLPTELQWYAQPKEA
ncbi:hypothetical protein [Streptomyces sp. NPDC007991]|uniref:hypothetical protein n=1 Tax=Streptomyces sp. NPDC007991 TaxID=3364803 RepID=UPI0036E6797B